MIAEIRLAGGRFALVDEADLELVSPYKWCVSKVNKPHDREYSYAITTMAGKTVRMHRFLMGLTFGDGLLVDHRDGNTLNNTRANLRICTRSQNCMNSVQPAGSASRYKGVSKFRDSYVASTVERKKKNHLGIFKSEVLAAVIYNNYIRTTRGEFARPNLIRYEDEINKLLEQKAEIERQIELLCAMELEQV